MYIATHRRRDTVILLSLFYIDEKPNSKWIQIVQRLSSNAAKRSDIISAITGSTDYTFPDFSNIGTDVLAHYYALRRFRPKTKSGQVVTGTRDLIGHALRHKRFDD